MNEQDDKKQEPKNFFEAVDEKILLLGKKLLKLQDKVSLSKQEQVENDLYEEQVWKLKDFKKTVARKLTDWSQLTKEEISKDSGAGERIYIDCIKKAEDLRASFREDRTFRKKLDDCLADILNFCIKVVTIGKSPHFFSTTDTKPADTFTREIKVMKSAYDKFVKEEVDIDMTKLDKGTHNP